MMVNNNLLGGFNFQPTPLKNDGVNVSWEYTTFPTEWKKYPNVPKHQPE